MVYTQQSFLPSSLRVCEGLRFWHVVYYVFSACKGNDLHKFWCISGDSMTVSLCQSWRRSNTTACHCPDWIHLHNHTGGWRKYDTNDWKIRMLGRQSLFFIKKLTLHKKHQIDINQIKDHISGLEKAVFLYMEIWHQNHRLKWIQILFLKL